MRSARGAAFSSSAARFRTAPDSFQMPAQTSHTSRPSPTKARSLKQTPMPGVDETQACSESDQNLLAMLNSTVACLKEKHMDIEALGCLEQSLWLKRRMFGIESPVVHKALHEVVLSYNSIAMQYLAQSQFDQCLSMLRKAEAITAPPGNFKNCQSLQILTYNNIGCCYRKLGKLKSALKYLKEAAQVGAGCAHVKNLSITHLNLCAIQSQLGRHDLALEHAQAAIFHTQEELVGLEAGSNDADGELRSDDVLDAKSREEKIISLAVAYHNLAVELEFNGRGEASLQWYKKALQLVARFRDSNQALCESFEKIFLDAKRKYQGHQSQQSQAATAATANRAARPKSAHPSSTRSGSKTPTPGANAAAPRDVSYTATVASKCYKPTKPSAAGLQYARPSPSKPASRTFPQRPSSATSSRRRPLSASSSTRQSTSVNRAVDVENESTSDTVERRWQQIEAELFGHQNGVAENDSIHGSSRPAWRPQSARHVRHVPQPRSPEFSRSRGVDNARSAAVDESFMKDDDECGIIQDEGDDDELEAQFYQPTNGRSGSREGRADTQEARVRPSNTRTSSNHRVDQHAPASARHRLVLEESRHVAPSRPRTTGRRQELDEDSEGIASSGGYAAEEDDAGDLSEASSSSDVPQQRVSHMEYLRRMKKLSDNIHEDLFGKGSESRSSSAAVRQDRAPKSEPVMQKQPSGRDTQLDRSGSGRSRHGEELFSASSTPRSASKVRERLELVRRDSVKSLEMNDDADHENKADVEATSSVLNAPGVPITEDMYMYATEADVLAAEQELLAHASARRIQSAARGNAACRRFEAVRQQKVKEREVQMRAKRAVIEAKELELQAQREARQADRGDQAARIIQHAMRSKHEMIEAKERELQAQREARQAERDEQAARAIQDVYRRHVHAHDADEDVDDSMDRDAVDNAEEEEEEEHYTPLPSARSTASHRATETSTNASLLNTPRSSEGDSAATSPLSPRSTSDATPRTPSLTVPPTPRNSVVAPTPRPSLSSSSRDHHDAALRIQCAFRKHSASQLVAARRARRLSRSYLERTHMSLVLTQAEGKELPFLEELCAIKVQAVARGRQARFLYEAMRIGRHAAASAIQTGFRRHRHDVQRSTTRGVESIAARNIQRHYRAYAHRRAHKHQLELYEEALDVHHIAAQTVQRQWRLWCAQRDRKIEEWEAATCIQALSRGHLARKSYDSLKASASRSSAFAIDHEERREETDDNYEEGFDEEEEKPSSGTNSSFLPSGVRALFEEYAAAPHRLPTIPSTTSEAVVQEMLNAGYGLDELAEEFETCADVESAVTLLDTMRALVEFQATTFKTLSHVVRVARAMERRIDDDAFWVAAVETRAAAFLLLYDDVLLAAN